LLPGGAEVIELFGLHMGQLELSGGWLAVRIIIFLGVVWGFPNIYQWLRDYPTALGFQARPSWVEQHVAFARWRPSPAFGLVVGTFSVFAVLFTLSGAPTEFLYFQF
jgi:hypothetical protein